MKKLLRTMIVMAVGSILILAISAVPVRAQTFIALLNSGQEVPPTPSNSLGVAFMTFDGVLLCYSITYTDNLLAPETAAHFHMPGGPGVNAPVRFPISPDPSPLGTPKTGCVPAEGDAFTEEDVANLFSGLTYINVHTTAHPGGEIRGQVQQVLP